MKVAVIGSRTFKNYQLLKETLDNFDEEIDLICSGGAIGADSMGEAYAKENGIETLIFKPDWKTYGKAAGFLRNTTIIENCDVVFCFWDGISHGTKDSMDKAKKLGKVVYVTIFK